MWSRAIFLRFGRNFNAVWKNAENELVATEASILNELGFDLDTYPTFFDVVEIFMA